MYCWNCGREVIEGAAFCSNCGAEQKTLAPPKDSPGVILSRTVKAYGEEKALTEPNLLPEALLQAMPEADKLAMRLRMALEEGVGTMYLSQLPQGGPDAAFLRKVESLLSDRIGFSDAVARELTSCLNVALGWPARAAQPRSAPSAEPPRAAAASGPQASPAAHFAPAANNRPEKTAGAGDSSGARTLSDRGACIFGIVLGALMLFLGYVNARDMAAGDLYTVVLGFLPAQYLLFPGGAIFLIGALYSWIFKKK